MVKRQKIFFLYTYVQFRNATECRGSGFFPLKRPFNAVNGGKSICDLVLFAEVSAI